MAYAPFHIQQPGSQRLLGHEQQNMVLRHTWGAIESSWGTQHTQSSIPNNIRECSPFLSISWERCPIYSALGLIQDFTAQSTFPTLSFFKTCYYWEIMTEPGKPLWPAAFCLIYITTFQQCTQGSLHVFLPSHLNPKTTNLGRRWGWSSASGSRSPNELHDWGGGGVRRRTWFSKVTVLYF